LSETQSQNQTIEPDHDLFNEDDLLQELEGSGFDVPDEIEKANTKYEDLHNQNVINPQFGEKLQITDDMINQNQEQSQEDRIKQGVKNFMSAPNANSQNQEDEDLPPLPQIPDDL